MAFLHDEAKCGGISIPGNANVPGQTNEHMNHNTPRPLFMIVHHIFEISDDHPYTMTQNGCQFGELQTPLCFSLPTRK
jgi:hypothetical protein